MDRLAMWALQASQRKVDALCGRGLLGFHIASAIQA
jgi:hypothetical protein